MIKLISGSTRIGSTVFTPESGVFSADKEIEERLVALNAAVFVHEMSGENEKVSSEADKSLKANNGSADNENDPESICEGDAEIFDGSFNVSEEKPDHVYDLSYDTNSSVSDLRKIGKAVGLTFPVGTTKKDMLAVLDSYFGQSDTEAPSLDISAEEPVE